MSTVIDSVGSGFRLPGTEFPPEKLPDLFSYIDKAPEFYGAAVIFMDSHGNIQKLRENCRADGRSVVIMQRSVRSLSEYQTNSKAAESKSTLGSESLSAVLSCGSATITWLLLVGEGASGEVTLGATWAAMPLTTASALASSAACGVSTGRLINSAAGNSDYNDMLDHDPIFSGAMLALDVVQMVDVVKSLGKSAQLIKLLKSKQFGSKGVLAAYKAMDRASRKRLAQEILKLEYSELRGSQKALKQILNGERLLPTGEKAIKVYNQAQVQALLKTKLVEFLGSVFTTAGSYNGGTIDYLIGVVE
jgi:hypothetical protein